MQNKTKTIISLSIVVLASLGLIFYLSKKPQTEAPVTSQITPTQKAYKDGDYEAEGSYRSPAMQETIGLKITLKDNIITAASVTEHATHPTSIKMQQQFKDGFSVLVVGKNIDELTLDIVNGSSLTPKGFMAAIEKIKQEAAI